MQFLFQQRFIFFFRNPEYSFHFNIFLKSSTPTFFRYIKTSEVNSFFFLTKSRRSAVAILFCISKCRMRNSVLVVVCLELEENPHHHQ